MIKCWIIIISAIILALGIISYRSIVPIDDYLGQYPFGKEWFYEAGVPYDDVLDCYNWAFGDSWETMDIKDGASVFRELHQRHGFYLWTIL